ncbi:hypothetical protein F2Q68_00010132 [Brassica cretica]|uniref:Uncharacterized protein n=1 Tax=Brassica cretica TaxID=69181 RepID=A0A8S9KT81_BRACR|nr:hypothetical protein F2Q68_00010132 [Brassica cretica]
MAQDDATFGAPGGEPTPTPEAAPPIPADFMSSVMARFARQDEVQKTTNDQLAALVAALTAPDGQTSRPQMIRCRLFNTNPTTTGEKAPKDDVEDDSSADEEQPANRRCIEVILSQQTLSSDDENDDAPIPGDLRDVLKRKLESKDDNSSENTDLRLTLNARKSQRISTSDPDPKEHMTRLSGDLRDKLTASAPKDDSEDDSSADEEQTANRRRIEVILSQQNLSSDDKNDDAPKPGDLRDVLKRKLESKEDNSFENTDLRLTLDARKSQRTSTGGPDPKEHPTQKAPKDDVEDDSSADEEQPANRRCIEVILSQQTLSSDDENDDAPIPGDLRDVLKRKLESKDDNSSENTDLRLTLNARKSQRISTSDPDPKEHMTRLSGDLRDKLTASVCDLRVLLNRSKPTDLRRQLEQTKTPDNPTLS